MLDQNTIKILFVCCLFMGFTISAYLLHFLKKRGVDVNSGKVIVPLGLLGLYIGALPLYFDPRLDMKARIVMTIMGAVAGLGNYFSVTKAGVVFRKTFGIKTKEKQHKDTRTRTGNKQ